MGALYLMTDSLKKIPDRSIGSKDGTSTEFE